MRHSRQYRLYEDILRVTRRIQFNRYNKAEQDNKAYSKRSVCEIRNEKNILILYDVGPKKNDEKTSKQFGIYNTNFET